MKLTPISKKLHNSIRKSINLDVYDKTHNSISREIKQKIDDEIYTPNLESIQEMQRRTLRNLKNSSK